MEKVTRLPLDHDRAVERRRLHIREVAEGGAESYDTVGAELKAARLRLGEDLRSVASALRIRPEHLEAIEEGAFEKLPGRAYAIGFVRAYAEYLGLDPAVIVTRFKEEAGGMPEPSPEQMLFDEPEDQPEQPQGMLIGLIVLFVIAIGAAAYFGKAADKMLGERMAGETAGTAPATAPAPEPEEQPTANVVPPPASPAPATTAESPATPAQSHASGVPIGASRITITALRDGVWLRVEDQASGEVLITRKLKAQDHYNVPNRPNLILVTRDGGALELTLDGTPIGRAGGPGSVIDGMALNPDVLAGRLPAPAPGPAPGPTPVPPGPAAGPTAAPQASSPAAAATGAPIPGAPATAPVPHKAKPKPATPPAIEVAPAPPISAPATPRPGVE